MRPAVPLLRLHDGRPLAGRVGEGGVAGALVEQPERAGIEPARPLAGGRGVERAAGVERARDLAVGGRAAEERAETIRRGVERSTRVERGRLDRHPERAREAVRLGVEAGPPALDAADRPSRRPRGGDVGDGGAGRRRVQDQKVMAGGLGDARQPVGAGEDGGAEVAVAAVPRVDRAPGAEPRPAPLLPRRGDEAGAVDDPRRDPKRFHVGRRHGALEAEQRPAGVDGDAARLGGLGAGRVEGLVVHLDDRAERAVGDHAVVAEVGRAPELPVGPDGRAAGAERRPDGVEVGALAGVVVVVVLGVPAVDDEVVRPLRPHVDAAADEVFERPETLAVGAEGDAVVLPGHVVATRVVVHVGSWRHRGGRGRLDAVLARLLGPEAHEEEELVGRPVAVGVERLDGHLGAVAVEGADAVGREAGHAAGERVPTDGDDLVGPGRLGGVLDPDRRGLRAGGGDRQPGEEQGERARHAS